VGGPSISASASFLVEPSDAGLITEVEPSVDGQKVRLELFDRDPNVK
jgi:hypothetical protein